MSNIVPYTSTVPAHLAGRVNKSALATAIVGGIGTGTSFPRISVKGSRFRIVEDGTETVLDSTSLGIVIVGANSRLSKTFYANAWSPDADAAAPDCYSLDGIRPHHDAKTPQHDLCASCPNNAWGSKLTPDGKKVKACPDQKRLAVVSADDPSGAIYLLQITPSALAGLAKYHKELSVRGIDPAVTRTIVGFDTDSSFPKLKFGFGGYLDAATQAEIDKALTNPVIPEITGEASGDVGAVPVHAALPKPVAAKEPPKKAEEEEEEEVVEEVPAPVPTTAKRTGFGNGKAAAAPAPAPAPAAAKRTGFGNGKAAAAPAAAKPAPREPAAATTAGTAMLADEITKLIGDVTDDA